MDVAHADCVTGANRRSDVEQVGGRRGALFTLASGGRLTLGAQDYETPADADNDNVYEATVVTLTDADAERRTRIRIEVTVTDVVETSTVTIGGLSYATDAGERDLDVARCRPRRARLAP